MGNVREANGVLRRAMANICPEVAVSLLNWAINVRLWLLCTQSSFGNVRLFRFQTLIGLKQSFHLNSLRSQGGIIESLDTILLNGLRGFFRHLPWLLFVLHLNPICFFTALSLLKCGFRGALSWTITRTPTRTHIRTAGQATILQRTIYW